MKNEKQRSITKHVLRCCMPILLMSYIFIRTSHAQKGGVVYAGAPSKMQNEISIKGTVQGYPENTKVRLAATRSGTLLDSTSIKNGKFSFTLLTGDTLRLGVFIDNPDLVYHDNEVAVFMIEGEDIEIVGKKDQLKYSRIKGGPIQNQLSEYKLLIEPYSRHFDKINPMLDEAVAAKQTAKADSIIKLQDDIINKRRDIALEYIEDHPTHYSSLLHLQSFMPLMNPTDVAKYFQFLDDDLKKRPLGKAIEARINANQLKAGQKAPDFELANLAGEKIKLSQFKGQYVLIDFWASWCKPCRIENKNLLAAYKEFNDNGFEIISISGDANKKSWANASKKDGIIWNSLIEDGKRNASTNYNVLLIPTNFLVDPSGKVIEKNLKGEALLNKLKTIYSEKQ